MHMRRKFYFILLFFTAITIQKIDAQLPEVSTPDNPLWYYIQVKGEDDRIGRVFTVTGNDIYGDYIENIGNEEDKDNRLWRFEKNAENYNIINKATNKKMAIRIAQDIESGLKIATLPDDTSESWELLEYNGYYQIKSASGHNYAHQANNYGGKRNYVIMFVGTDWYRSDNSLFSFIPYDKSLPQLSIGNEEYWYYILSGNPKYKDKCITDVSSSSNNEIKFDIQDMIVNKENQQWKAIRPINADDDLMLFINRQSGNAIQTKYEYNGQYCAQATKDMETTNGWELSHIDLNQFTIAGVNEDGYKGHLNISTENTDISYLPDAKNLLNSNYTWIFKKEPNPHGNSIEHHKQSPNILANIKIYQQGKRIIVEGVEEYTITSISGISYNKSCELPNGIYIVNIYGKTKAFLVK